MRDGKIKKYNLAFISDKDLFNHVADTVSQYRFEINLKKFNKNLIDPIKLTFDSKIYNKDFNEIIELEVIRQIDKSNTNTIGYFHQNIFKYLGGHDWVVPKSGYDVINEKLNIFVELKNKHNTMNSSSAQKIYKGMQKTILKNDEATCMLVEVISKKTQNITWKTSLDGEPTSNKNIRKVSIDKFYEIVTGNKLAFKLLCEQLPIVLNDVISSNKKDLLKNSVFTELKEMSPNILESIYLLAFKNYDGFETFKV